MKKLLTALICLTFIVALALPASSSLPFALPASADTVDDVTAQQLDVTDTYYYDRISERQQWCYNYLKDYYDNFEGDPGQYDYDFAHLLPENADNSMGEALWTDFVVANVALRADNPLYYMKGEIGGYSMGTENGKNTFIFTFSHQDLNTDAYNEQISARITQIIETVGNGDRYTKLRKLSHYILSNTFYDPYLDNINMEGNRDFALATRGHFYNQSIYGLFLKNISICDGFSQSVKVLCNELDIPCIIMGNKAHAWNIVQMEDGTWYRFDITNESTLGWDESVDFDDYYNYVFLNDNVWVSSDTYSDPYMINVFGVKYVTDFPQIAEGAYQYTGETTDFSYEVAPNRYVHDDAQFIYEVHPTPYKDQKTCTIIDYVGEQKGDLIIPSVIDGYTVTSIGPYAFYYCTGFDGKLVIPDTVTKIEKAAFTGCYNIKSIEFSANLRVIETGAFMGCKALTAVDLPDLTDTFGDYAFFDCPSLTINASAHLQYIGSNAFGIDKFHQLIPTVAVSAPENSAVHRYATDKGIAFATNDKSCDFIDDDGEWNFWEGDHSHVCKHGARFDVGKHTLDKLDPCGTACDVCGIQVCTQYGFFESVEVIKNAILATCTSPEYTGDVWCICNLQLLREGRYVGEALPHTAASEVWERTEYEHFRYCECGWMVDYGGHEGGTATTTSRAICDVCGAEYGELIHSHSPKDNVWITDSTQHFKLCECGEWINVGLHIGGTATVTERAKCDICGAEYGELIHVHSPKDDVWLADSSSHFQLCECGEWVNYGDHTGGTPTYTETPICEICGVHYGDILCETEPLATTEITEASATQAPTESETAETAATEATTESETTETPTTDAPTEPETDAPSTDAPSTNAPETDAPETETNAPETQPDDSVTGTNTPNTDPPSDTSSGCTGIIGIEAISIIAISLISLFSIKKKEDQ